MKNICLFLLASMLISQIAAVDCTGKDAAGKDIPAGCTPKPAAAGAAGAAPPAPESKITSNVKKANRRTPMEILNDVQSSKEDKVNWIIFQKEDYNNPVSSKENPKEIAMYEKFITNINGKWEGCVLQKNIVVDVVEVTDPLAEELLRKLKVNKDAQFQKRTMSLVIGGGSGNKIQGPTAYLKIAEELAKPAPKDVLKDTNGACAKAFFDKVVDAAAPAGGAAAAGDKCLATNCICGADGKKAAAGTAGATFTACKCSAAGIADGAATSNNANCK
jgi:hypothetical protein